MTFPVGNRELRVLTGPIRRFRLFKLDYAVGLGGWAAWIAIWGILLLSAGQSVSPALAASSSQSPDVVLQLGRGVGRSDPPTDPIALKAFGVLRQHCARCHEAIADVPVEAERSRALGKIPHILDLDWLKRQGELVQPGHPEGSVLFAKMVARMMPFDAQHGSKNTQELEVHEIEAVGDWIKSLKPDDRCVRPVATLLPAQKSKRIAQWLDGPLLSPAERQGVGLVHLGRWDSCRGDPPRSVRGEAAGLLLRGFLNEQVGDLLVVAIPGIPDVVGVVPVSAISGPSGSILAGLAALQPPDINSALGVSAAAKVGVAAISLPWLAGYALRTATLPDGAAPLGGRTVASARVVEALARMEVRSVTARDVALALGVRLPELRDTLMGHQDAVLPVVETLLSGGVVSRARWSDIVAGMLDRPAEAGGGAAMSPEGGDDTMADLMPDGLDLWAEARAYDQGDELTLNVATQRDCRLSVINIDASGTATVLFPNVYHSDNRLKAGTRIQIPEDDDPYILALETAGRETFLAICLLEDRMAPPGVRHDFDIQPFTILGNWRNHRRAALEADAVERANVGRSLSKRQWRRLARRGIVRRYSKSPLKQMRRAIQVEVQPARPGQ